MFKPVVLSALLCLAACQPHTQAAASGTASAPPAGSAAPDADFGAALKQQTCTMMDNPDIQAAQTAAARFAKQPANPDNAEVFGLKIGHHAG